MTGAELEGAIRAVWNPSRPAVIHPAPTIAETVDGGAAAVCEAILAAAGRRGTVLMPAFTATRTVVGLAQRPEPFRIDLPVSTELGKVPEEFRRLPGVIRSSHPSHSFAAWGLQAEELLSTHRDDNPLGPLKKLNVAQGSVVLLGSGLENALAIHLAEESASHPYLARAVALRINSAGYQERIVIHRFPRCSRAFVRLEPAIAPERMRVVTTAVGLIRAVAVRELVRLAAAMLRNDPRVFVCDDEACEGCRIRREAVG